MMRNFSRQRLDLDSAMKTIGAVFNGEPHIKFDPNVDHQYRIIRRSVHDGTLIFSHELIFNAMHNLFKQTSYYKPEPIPEGMIPVYTVGRIRIAAVYGMVDLPCGRYPGMRESVTIPVSVAFVPLMVPN
ncbi:hypothetical protein [Nevskia ramosa]|uniref:hypothetical protein n=1 Tax=Nevskia ramosa TaxID=64002 RepID=UPI003D0F9093